MAGVNYRYKFKLLITAFARSISIFYCSFFGDLHGFVHTTTVWTDMIFCTAFYRNPYEITGKFFLGRSGYRISATSSVGR